MSDLDLAKVPRCSDCKHKINRSECISPEIEALSVVFDGTTYKGGMIRQLEARLNPGLCSLAGYWFEEK